MSITLEAVCQSYKGTAEAYRVKRIKAIEYGDRLKAAECASNAEYFKQVAEWLDELIFRRSQHDRLMFDTVAKRVERKMKESNDFIVFDNKRYVSYSELCEVLEGKYILEEGD